MSSPTPSLFCSLFAFILLLVPSNVLQTPTSYHHFAQQNDGAPSPNFGRIIAKEYKTLMQGIPKGAFVTAYSSSTENLNLLENPLCDRKKIPQEILPKKLTLFFCFLGTDLMKLLIIGPPNTVYCHSYFIFDIKLPQNYPQEPPKVFFHSQGLKVHPNLYIEGKVCCV